MSSASASGSASASPSVTPVDDLPAAAKDFGRFSDAGSVKSKSTIKGSQPAADNPITPLQADLAYPQRRTYTPSDSDPSSAIASTAGSASTATQRAQHGGSFESAGQDQANLKAKFDQVNRGKHADDSDSSVTEQLPQQKQTVSDAADEEEQSEGSIQPQLSSPQSRPATPSSPGNVHRGNRDGHLSVTHVNTCFAKSDDDDDQDESHGVMSNSTGSQDDSSDMAEEEQQSDEEVRGLSLVRRLKRQIVKLKSALESKSLVSRLHWPFMNKDIVQLTAEKAKIPGLVSDVTKHSDTASQQPLSVMLLSLDCCL